MLVHYLDESLVESRKEEHKDASKEVVSSSTSPRSGSPTHLTQTETEQEFIKENAVSREAIKRENTKRETANKAHKKSSRKRQASQQAKNSPKIRVLASQEEKIALKLAESAMQSQESHMAYHTDTSSPKRNYLPLNFTSTQDPVPHPTHPQDFIANNPLRMPNPIHVSMQKAMAAQHNIWNPNRYYYPPYSNPYHLDYRLCTDFHTAHLNMLDREYYAPFDQHPPMTANDLYAGSAVFQHGNPVSDEMKLSMAMQQARVARVARPWPNPQIIATQAQEQAKQDQQIQSSFGSPMKDAAENKKQEKTWDNDVIDGVHLLASLASRV